jgi:hypothetical protein
MPVLVDLDQANLATLPCCGVKNPAHEGRRRKNCWLTTHLKKGLRAKVALTSGKRPCGYIESLPGEYAWRAVDARGYLFIHCVWTFSKQDQSKGVASQMVEACLQDARKAGMSGVAVVARDGPWLAGPALFLANGFVAVDTAPPDYQLLVCKFDASAANPAFKGGWEKKLMQYGRGLTLIRSDQCPHIAKFADEIAQTAAEEFGVKLKIVELKSHRDAQNAPTPYGVFALISDGHLLADHQISRTRFRNIMNQV